jgi:hypothetical protein
MMPDKNSRSDPRTRSGGVRLILGGVVTAVLLIAILLLLTGKPDPQQGESFPNAPPQIDRKDQ